MIPIVRRRRCLVLAFVANRLEPRFIATKSAARRLLIICQSKEHKDGANDEMRSRRGVALR